MIISPEQARRKLRTQADRAFRALILGAAQKIISRTPVDTGRARGNWQISVDTADVTEMGDDKGGGATIMGVRADVLQADIDDKVFLLNGVPYIQRLEDGWSDQIPPGGMVKVTLAEMQQIAAEVAQMVRALQ